MAEYIVDKNAQEGSDEHQVHDLSLDCHHVPAPENQLSLGDFPSSHKALKKAKKTYPNSNGCYFCCWQCRTV